jgi:CitMHS family citrate-Mg2+:H+ or citrate-Ca2+:H+ symporter
VNGVLRLVGRRPSRITVGTSLLALLIHLDGSGAVCFLITVPAMLPLYDQLGMDRRILACCASLAAGVNFLPWTGPTLRASAALHIPTAQIFAPMLPVQIVGLIFVFGAAWWMGRREEKRLAALPTIEREIAALKQSPPIRCIARACSGSIWRSRWRSSPDGHRQGRARRGLYGRHRAGAGHQLSPRRGPTRPDRGACPPRDDDGRHPLRRRGFHRHHEWRGLIHALAQSSVAVPTGMGARIPLLVAVTSMPLSMLFDPDSFYFGVLPVVAQVAGHFGVAPVQVAQAALLGMHTVGFPVSPLTPATFLVAGLSRIELGAHQRFAFPWLFAATLVMTLAALALGLIGL